MFCFKINILILITIRKCAWKLAFVRVPAMLLKPEVISQEMNNFWRVLWLFCKSNLENYLISPWIFFGLWFYFFNFLQPLDVPTVFSWILQEKLDLRLQDFQNLVLRRGRQWKAQVQLVPCPQEVWFHRRTRSVKVWLC